MARLLSALWRLVRIQIYRLKFEQILVTALTVSRTDFTLDRGKCLDLSDVQVSTVSFLSGCKGDSTT